MKRTCGEGELIPIRFEVVSCSGKSDDEKVQKFTTLEFALSAYRAQVLMEQNIPCSDVRLYACDKQGYANCIKMWIHDAKGQISERDDTAQLID